ncbi:MAG: SIR2 family protein [Acidobacteriia bacterium]|nr:SIR2 family protein [Terriglobia bacterium]
MKKVDLVTAVGHIKQVCGENRAIQDRLPFFFLVGSGLSYPPVPLAAKIEESCKVLSREQKRTTAPAGKRAIDTYSHWFDHAYPHPIERQRYLRSLIEGKSISHANFRLAHLLLDKRVANLVVTTNFDDFLSRALNLFGKPHIVCDHPRTVERINPEADDVQIVHVHGSYWFYDCCNLVGEIEERSRSSAENSFTMASLLDTILARRSPLVVGYGGWEGDVVMCALKRRLQNRLPYNLYWFCYRDCEAEALPEFLREHPNVYFVVADDPTGRDDALKTPAAVSAAAPAGDPATPEAAYEETPDVLPAQRVFDELIRAFDLPAPELTKDPLSYFATYLRQSLPQQDGLSAEVDIYSLGSVIERIEGARGRAQVKGAETRMERIRDYLRRSQYRDAIRLGAEMASTKLRPGESRDLLRTMLTAAWRLDDNSAEEIQGYDLVIRLGDAVPKPDAFVRERVAMAMVNKGLALAGANRHHEAIETFKAAVQRFGRERDLFFRQQSAEALFNRAYSLSAMGRHRQAVDAYQSLIRRLNHAREVELQELTAMAMLNQGCEWGELRNPEEELKAYGAVVKRFSRADDPDVQIQVGRAFYNWGVTLDSLNRPKSAAKAYQALIDRFELSRNRELRDLVDSARANLAQPEPEGAGPGAE